MKKANNNGNLKAFLLGMGMVLTLTVAAYTPSLIGLYEDNAPVIIAGGDDDIDDVHKAG